MKHFPWHSILFTLHAVLFLFAQNIDSVLLEDLWQPLGYTLALGTLVFVANYFLAGGLAKAGLATSAFVLLFFGYGHYADLVYAPNADKFPSLFQYDVYLWGSAILFLALIFSLRRSKSDLGKINQLITVIALVLIAAPAYIIATNFFHGAAPKTPLSEQSGRLVGTQKADDNSPSVYYFIMDAYGRNDVLQEYFGHDNSAFTDELKNLGFYVADRSFANYNKTILSVPSALNMEYLDALANELGPESKHKQPLFDLFDANRTIKNLKDLGYTTVSLDASIWNALYVDSADVFYKTPGVHVNMFQTELYNLSILQAIDRARAEKASVGAFDHHRKKILTGFKRIVEVSKMEGPLYVHAHFLSPHQPFVFDENGEPVNPAHEYSLWIPIEEGRDPTEYRKEYIAQLKFINKKLIETIGSILENSKVPPIIIIQGDHGPCSELRSINTIEGNDFSERMPILNAYYFPDGNYEALYPGISPVNSFRLVFSQFFGMDYPLLPDSCYYSSWERDYDLVNVTDSLNLR